MMSQSRARIFVEIRVTGTGEGYGPAMSFIKAINLNGLKTLEAPSSGYIDAQKLMRFIPQLPRGYEYIDFLDPFYKHGDIESHVICSCDDCKARKP